MTTQTSENIILSAMCNVLLAWCKVMVYAANEKTAIRRYNYLRTGGLASQGGILTRIIFTRMCGHGPEHRTHIGVY